MIQSTRGLVTEGLSKSGWTLSGTVTDDGGGGGTVSVVAGGTVACRIDAMGDTGESSVANRISDRSTHLITSSPDLSISTDQQFVIDGRGTYEVTAIREHTGEFTTLFEAVERA